MMKKLLTIIIIAAMTSFMACGPSAKEKALQAKLDSIAKQDSIAKSVQIVSYDFEKHGDIKVFIDDLIKAVNSDDKNSIAQMINLPFKDEWGDNPYNQSTPLGCKTENQFFEKQLQMMQEVRMNLREAQPSHAAFPRIISEHFAAQTFFAGLLVAHDSFGCGYYGNP